MKRGEEGRKERRDVGHKKMEGRDGKGGGEGVQTTS